LPPGFLEHCDPLRRAKSNYRKTGDLKVDFIPWRFLRGIR
jgi:hypothetical protein